jgi:membrane protease YdiL (CAAX protease family)
MRAWLRTTISRDGDLTPSERLIPPIPRTSPPAAGVILACVGIFSVAGLSQSGFSDVSLWVVAALGVLVLAAALTGSAAALHITIFCFFVMLSYRTPGMGIHPFPLVSALAGYGVVVLGTPRLRETTFWLHTGSLEVKVRRLVLVAVVASAIGLPIWSWLVGPEVREMVAAFDDLPTWALLPIGATFALVNAGAEEAAFRGILMDALVSAVGEAGAVVIQAVAFGLVHYPHGLPNGTWGALLSGIYGLFLGFMRLRAGGMLAPWIAHVATDLTIFVLLLTWLPAATH